MTDSKRLELALPATMDRLPSFLGAVTHLAEQAGLDPNRIMMIELATEEALVNIIKYAYPNEGGSITLIGRSAPSEALTLTIIDQGQPFDVLAAPDPDIDLGVDDRPIGGLGVHFMKKVANKISYTRNDNQNELLMVFEP
ncbi:MAG: ATP-binding protein [Deltaproteobacteria bacterium]|nr:ATP-binding protein [Deltaproteobacteria bacterium]